MLHDDIINFQNNEGIKFSLGWNNYIVPDLFLENPACFYFKDNHFVNEEMVRTGASFLKEKILPLPFPCSIFLYDDNYAVVVGSTDYLSRLDITSFRKLFDDGEYDSFLNKIYYNEFFWIKLWVSKTIDDQIYINASPSFGFFGNENIFYEELRGHDYKLSNDINVEQQNCFEKILSSLVFLNTKYATRSNVDISEKLNKKRNLSGRAKLSNYSIISLDKTYLSADGEGKHSSPKPHWRRGHGRTLKSGRRVKVQPCPVNFNPSGNAPNKGIYRK